MTKDAAFLATVNRTAQHLAAGLQSLAVRFSSRIVEVRQLGLAAAVKFADPFCGALMMSALFKHGVWAMAAAFDLSVIRINPPLIIDCEKLDLLLEALNEAMVDCWGSPVA